MGGWQAILAKIADLLSHGTSVRDHDTTLPRHIAGPEDRSTIKRIGIVGTVSSCIFLQKEGGRGKRWWDFGVNAVAFSVLLFGAGILPAVINSA